MLSLKVIEDRLFTAVGEALNDPGERRKFRDQDLLAWDISVGEVLDSNWISRFGVRESFATSGGNRVESIDLKCVDGRFKSSRTSLIVKEAYAIL